MIQRNAVTAFTALKAYLYLCIYGLPCKDQLIFGGLGRERRYRRDRAQSSYQKGIGGASSSWKERRRGGERASSWACLSPSSARRASKRYLCARVAVGLKKRGICCHHNTTSICDLPPPPEVFVSWQDCHKNLPLYHSVLYHITLFYTWWSKRTTI